ncbi:MULTISPECIES: ion transporter [Cyanophyceae]|uniref:ion transporter n=1 Tax=Cyanophyceae TaxID=3028117 RepID=UPI001688F9A4|nr:MULTISPECIES: ion transporter [Cyanophyceae]MBD1919003.1 ion transporter [Phormidium sp. FACHB-77]MBD2031965.1 ion transporter [Phormidium sp. FACHB-322]MBD2053928.1 ion transporter [Leptolyngbya sp. FACHB-60]
MKEPTDEKQEAWRDGQRPALRERLRDHLDTTDTVPGRVINSAIVLLIFMSATIFVIKSYPISAALDEWLDILDWLIVLAFTLEYGLRLWTAPRPWQYAFSLYGLIDLIAILPSWIGVFDIRFLRFFRSLRILRLVRIFNDRLWFGQVTSTDSLILIRILLTLGTIIFIYSGLIFQVEHPSNPEDFGTFLDALYFAVVTMTTVGYGDVTPISEAGRGLTVMMILTGIALIPTQISRLIRQLGKVSQPQHLPCPNCGLTLHDDDAQFCKRCGTLLEP